jgi:hypothetical protein
MLYKIYITAILTLFALATDAQGQPPYVVNKNNYQHTDNFSAWYKVTNSSDLQSMKGIFLRYKTCPYICDGGFWCPRFPFESIHMSHLEVKNDLTEEVDVTVSLTVRRTKPTGNSYSVMTEERVFNFNSLAPGHSASEDFEACEVIHYQVLQMKRKNIPVEIGAVSKEPPVNKSVTKDFTPWQALDDNLNNGIDGHYKISESAFQSGYSTEYEIRSRYLYTVNFYIVFKLADGTDKKIDWSIDKDETVSWILDGRGVVKADVHITGLIVDGQFIPNEQEILDKKFGTVPDFLRRPKPGEMKIKSNPRPSDMGTRG